MITSHHEQRSRDRVDEQIHVDEILS